MGNSKIKNLQERNAELRKLLERTTSERDNWRITAEGRGIQADQARHERDALKAKAAQDAREKRLADLCGGIVRLGDAEVTVSKKNDGESWVTVNFQADAEEVHAVEGYLASQAAPKWDPIAPGFSRLSRIISVGGLCIPQHHVVGQ